MPASICALSSPVLRLCATPSLSLISQSLLPILHLRNSSWTMRKPAPIKCVVTLIAPPRLPSTDNSACSQGDVLSGIFHLPQSLTTASTLTSVSLLYSSTMSQSSTAITLHMPFSAAKNITFTSSRSISLPTHGDPGTPQSSDNTQRTSSVTAVPTQTVYSSISSSTTAQHLSTR